MTAGLWLAIASGFLWSITNIIDKTVVSKYITDPRLIFIPLSTVYVVIGAGVLIFFGHGLPAPHLLIALATGLTFLAMNYLYFVAAKREEISRVVPLFALSSVFLAAFGALFLGEIFHIQTYSGIIAIVLGSMLIMLRGSLRELFQSRVLGIMTLAALVTAVHALLMKYLLNSHSYWTVFGWISLFDGILGLLFFSKQISALVRLIRSDGWKGVILVVISEANGKIASLFFTLSISVWYVTLANTVSLVQYLFLFIWTIIVSRFTPKLFTEKITPPIAIQKIVATALIIGGVVLIS